jgi:hypothetical protein
LRGRRLLAVKLLLIVPWAVFTLLVWSGALPLVFGAISLVTIVPLAILFSRWEAADLARRPIVEVRGPAPQPGDVFRYSSWYARLFAAVIPAVFGAAVGLLLFWAPYVWLAGIPLAICVGWLLWRCLHISLELNWENVVVKNQLRTHRLRWGDITHIFVGSDGSIVFLERGHTAGIDAVATRWPRLRPALVHEIRRYGEPHGIEFGEELLRL